MMLVHLGLPQWQLLMTPGVSANNILCMELMTEAN
jgi:hypothetical protein